MIRRFFKIIIFVILSVCFVQCGLAAERIPVFVSIVPQEYFVQQIGKDLVDVAVLVQPGASPATYEPKPRQMGALSKARIYFAIGVPFENTWLPKITAANVKMKVVHTDHGIAKIPMEAHHHHALDEHHVEEDHRPEKSEHSETDGQHAHLPPQGALDPHIWLSPPLVKKQSRTILAALQEIDPIHSSAYADNFQQFMAAIDRLDADIREILAGRRGLQFMVFHPSWGYFARAYGLRQVPIEIEGKNPKPAQLRELIEHARENRIRVVFVQPQFSTRSAALVAQEIGGQVAFADPLAADWITNLRSVAGKFRMALE